MSCFTFKEQKKVGDSGESSLLNELLKYGIEGEVVDQSIKENRTLGDVNFTNRKGVDLSVEVKNDETKYTNIFLETVSVRRNGSEDTPGWIHTCSSNFFMYRFKNKVEGRKPYYMFMTKKLREYFASNESEFRRKYRERPVPNKGYTTLGIPVPIARMERELRMYTLKELVG